MTDPRWIHLPDGPWVLPNEDSDIYVRLITKTETPGQPTFTLTGSGYDATEHATLDEAMAEAEFYRFELVDDRPPMPTQGPLLPKELFVLESVWERWRGSTTAIAALAKRADEWMDTHWTSFQKVPKKAWYLRPGVLREQYFVTSSHSVTTTFWSGGVTADALQGELEARRDLVRLIKVESTAIVRSWPVTVCDDLPLTPAELPTPPPGVSVSWQTVSPPQQVRLEFQTSNMPAVRLRIVAPTAQLCVNLHKHMHPHVDAGKRGRPWDPAVTGSAAAILGFAIPDVLLLTGVIQPWWTMVLQFTCGPLGMLIPLKLIPWAFPPLELVEAWEKPRWSTVKTWFWQGLVFLIAVVGIILTVLLSQPSSPAPTPAPTSSVGASTQP
jgi:hypothetical protein